MPTRPKQRALRPSRHPKRPHVPRVALRELMPGHHTFSALFVKHGKCGKTGHVTVLLRDVRIGIKDVAEHLWINTGHTVLAPLEWRHLSNNVRVELVACVTPYIHGQPNNQRNPLRVEYTLGDVRSVKVKESK